MSVNIENRYNIIKNGQSKLYDVQIWQIIWQKTLLNAPLMYLKALHPYLYVCIIFPISLVNHWLWGTR